MPFWIQHPFLCFETNHHLLAFSDARPRLRRNLMAIWNGCGGMEFDSFGLSFVSSSGPEILMGERSAKVSHKRVFAQLRTDKPQLETAKCCKTPVFALLSCQHISLNSLFCDALGLDDLRKIALSLKSEVVSAKASSEKNCHTLHHGRALRLQSTAGQFSAGT